MFYWQFQWSPNASPSLARYQERAWWGVRRRVTLKFDEGATLFLKKTKNALFSGSTVLIPTISLFFSTLTKCHFFTEITSKMIASRMVRIIKQGEYTSTIYRLIADGEYKEASSILESGKSQKLVKLWTWFIHENCREHIPLYFLSIRSVRILASFLDFEHYLNCYFRDQKIRNRIPSGNVPDCNMQVSNGWILGGGQLLHKTDSTIKG